MRIPAKNIKQLQKLYKKAFGVDIDTEEAQKQGLAIIKLVAITMEQNKVKFKK